MQPSVVRPQLRAGGQAAGGQQVDIDIADAATVEVVSVDEVQRLGVRRHLSAGKVRQRAEHDVPLEQIAQRQFADHERVDQDLTKTLDPDAPLTTDWRGDLLGGVLVIRGKFTDGSPMMAIPNYARTNRDKELPPEGVQGIGQDGAVRPAQRQATSVVWIRET